MIQGKNWNVDNDCHFVICQPDIINTVLYPRLLSVATTTGCAQLRWDRDRGVLCGHQPLPQPGTPQLHCYANRDTEQDTEPLGEELNMMEDKHLMSQGFFWTGSPFDGGWLGVAGKWGPGRGGRGRASDKPRRRRRPHQTGPSSHNVCHLITRP